MSDTTFEVGEPVFAKVKGYPAWPAEVTVIGGGKFEVFFFGTHETARLTAKDLFKVNQINIDKFSHPKMKARKWYKEGLDEMINLVKIRKRNASNPQVFDSIPTSGSKPLVITTPTKIPAIRSKIHREDATLSPVVLLDTRAVDKAKSAGSSSSGSSRSKSKMPTPVKKSNINKASIKKPSAQHDSRPSPELSDPYRRVAPTVTPSRRQLEDARKEATKSPVDNSKLDDSSKISSNATRKGSKRHPEPSDSPNKRQKSKDPIKISINISLEMSPETFLRVARELPGLLDLSSDQINTGINIGN